jgi:diguanylate cyclase (GGDEF)-like protein
MVLALLVAGIVGMRPAFAIDLVDVANRAPSLDLAPYLAGLQTDQRDVKIERPDSHTAKRDVMELKAKGTGPTFRWVAAGFTNTSTEPREVVLTIPAQGFTGSGFLPIRRVGNRVISHNIAGPVELVSMPVLGESAYDFTLAPGTTASIAFELSDGGVPRFTMWQRDAYDAKKDYFSFFRGALLGVSLLLSLALFALYGFRARAVFPVAGGFAVSSVAFMMFEAGHLPSIVEAVSLQGLDLQSARAVIEGAMAAFLILLMTTISELPRISRTAGHLLMILGALAFAIPIYGFAEPLIAASIARALFVLTAVAGFALIFMLWRKREAKAETALVSWSAILLWTFLATIAALQNEGSATLSVIVLAGLCAVLVVLGFTLAHYAFSQGYLSRHFFREAGRHALALAGARTYVWDWQPEEGELYVSPEIERSLAQPSGIFAVAGSEAFLELMHPTDRQAYLTAIAEVGYLSRAPVEKDFRLRHGDGGYRWFQLRARAIGGHGQRAMRCIGTLTDVTNSKIAEERLLQDAVFDVVTGLPNRALFTDRLERALEAAKRAPANLFVLMIDLDRFKMVNDAMGYEAGDSLLAIIGRRLKAETGTADSIARFPGDKFAILFRELPGERDVGSFAATLLKMIARPIMLDGQEYFLTASIGMAHCGDPHQDAEQVMKDASLALYEAKRRGSGTIELFNPEMQDERAELVVLEQELRRAIERNEIEVHYQPIARLSDMHLAGFEALVRWNHPALGLLAPESFIALAEETGMIRDIGRTVLNEAGRQLGIWQRAYRPAEPIFTAVNISSAQLIEPDLIDEVQQVLVRDGLARGSFKIEVTESLVMQYPERARQILERFQEMGVGVACDDFGTGYSSLSSLRKLPFDTLKVDKSFIDTDSRDQRAGVILHSVIGMAHALGLAIVAEGIENQRQVDRLGELGCDYGQGFFIGKPMTARQVNDALSGLPYASSTGRTAITWLWERGQKDPPPEPKLRRVTAEDIEQLQGAARPRPVPPPSQTRRAPVIKPAAVEPEEDEAPEPQQAPEPEEFLEQQDAAIPVSEQFEMPEAEADEVEVSTAEDVGGTMSESLAEEAEAAAAIEDFQPVNDNAILEGDAELPAPAPRRRRRKRRAPVLDAGEN